MTWVKCVIGERVPKQPMLGQAYIHSLLRELSNFRRRNATGCRTGARARYRGRSCRALV